MKSLVFCCVIVNCFVLGLCDVPQYFKLKFGDISCNQAVDVNSVIKNCNGKKYFRKITTMRESAVVVQKDYSTAQLKKCGVGMQDINKIKDNQITASSMWNEAHRPQYGRLFATRGIKAWCTQAGKVIGQWISVDLKKDTKIIGVVTAGRPPHVYNGLTDLHLQWVNTFTMEYKTDKNNYIIPFLDRTGKLEVFQGNTDMTTPVVNIFRIPITARWFTIKPINYHLSMCMQFDLLVC